MVVGKTTQDETAIFLESIDGSVDGGEHGGGRRKLTLASLKSSTTRFQVRNCLKRMYKQCFSI